MLSSHWSPWQALTLRLVALAVGALASWTAWRAARLWRRASELPIEDTTSRSAVSWDDSPASGVLEAVVALNAIRSAYGSSAHLNAKAAHMTAISAALTALLTLLGVV